MLTRACPASGQKKKEGLGLDVKGGEESPVEPMTPVQQWIRASGPAG